MRRIVPTQPLSISCWLVIFRKAIRHKQPFHLSLSHHWPLSSLYATPRCSTNGSFEYAGGVAPRSWASPWKSSKAGTGRRENASSLCWCALGTCVVRRSKHFLIAENATDFCLKLSNLSHFSIAIFDVHGTVSRTNQNQLQRLLVTEQLDIMAVLETRIFAPESRARAVVSSTVRRSGGACF